MIEIFVEGQKITSFYADADCVQKLGIFRAVYINAFRTNSTREVVPFNRFL